ncbi:MAG: hypothetical protein GXO50_04170 [Chlorobi bacterium]|nr:hypothetical protein [Chlorobiota bacterium]
MGKNILFNLKNRGIAQYAVIGIAFGILGYAVYVAVNKKNSNKVNPDEIQMKQVVNPALIGQSGTQKVNEARLSENKKRRKEQLKIELQKSEDINEVYIPASYDTGKKLKNKKITQVNFSVENNTLFSITPDKNETNKTKVKKETVLNSKIVAEPKNKEVNKTKGRKITNPLMAKYKADNVVDTVDPEAVNGPLSPRKYEEAIKRKINAIAGYYSAFFRNPASINGNLYVFPKASDMAVPASAGTVFASSAGTFAAAVPQPQNPNTKPLGLKVIPGSSYFARLMIPVENIYMKDVKPIAKIVDKNLKGYVLIGDGKETENKSGIILKFNRIVAPDGKEYPVNAVGINVRDITPKFVDSIDRHLLPRVVLATLASIADAAANSGQEYQSPSTTVLSSELQKELKTYQTEIKVNRQYFAVIFY